MVLQDGIIELGKRRAGCSGRRGWNDPAILSAALKGPSNKFLKCERAVIMCSELRSVFSFSNYELARRVEMAFLAMRADNDQRAQRRSLSFSRRELLTFLIRSCSLGVLSASQTWKTSGLYLSVHNSQTGDQVSPKKSVGPMSGSTLSLQMGHGPSTAQLLLLMVILIRSARAADCRILARAWVVSGSFRSAKCPVGQVRNEPMLKLSHLIAHRVPVQGGSSASAASTSATVLMVQCSPCTGHASSQRTLFSRSTEASLRRISTRPPPASRKLVQPGVSPNSMISSPMR